MVTQCIAMTGDIEQIIRLTIQLMSSFRMYFFYARPPPEFASGSSNDLTREKFVDQYASEYQPRSLKNLQFTESVHNDLSEWSESDNENNHRHQPPASSRYYNTGKLATISDRVGDGYYGEPAVKRVNHRAQRRIGKNWQELPWCPAQLHPAGRGRGRAGVHGRDQPRAHVARLLRGGHADGVAGGSSAA